MASYEDKDRYVVTGMGLVSPVGNDPETAWQTMLRGEHGVENVRDTLFAGYNSLPIHVAAPVKGFDLTNDPAFAGSKKEIRSKWDLAQQFILWASAQALRQAGLSSVEHIKAEDHGLDPERFGVYVGTGVGGVNHLADARAILEDEKIQYEQAMMAGDLERMAELEEATRINPKLILKSLPGRVAGTPSMVFGAKAFWEGVLKECASGNGAIISAIEAIKLGKADVVLAGGVEGDITPTTTGLFGAAHAVSRNRDPDSASRPFDAGRDGLIMGQGAGALVIESMAHALGRNASILAEIIGYAESADAKDETEPDPQNVAKSMHKALSMLDRPIHKLRGGAINPHATSTPIGDRSEIKMIRAVFRPDQLVGITAVKSYTGHTFGASGAIEAVASIQELRDNASPAVHNLERPIEEAEGYEHLMDGNEEEIEFVVNNSFGFGGNNAITIFGRPK